MTVISAAELYAAHAAAGNAETRARSSHRAAPAMKGRGGRPFSAAATPAPRVEARASFRSPGRVYWTFPPCRAVRVNSGAAIIPWAFDVSTSGAPAFPDCRILPAAETLVPCAGGKKTLPDPDMRITRKMRKKKSPQAQALAKTLRRTRTDLMAARISNADRYLPLICLGDGLSSSRRRGSNGSTGQNS